jgi:hypothetical protein
VTAAHPQAPYLLYYQLGKSVIARYHIDTAEIDAKAAELRAAGADGFSLSLWLQKDAVALGASDTFLDWDGAGNLAPQMQANLVAFLGKMKSLGFNFVQLAPQFYGENDFRQWGKNPDGSLLFKQDKANGNWNFLASLPGLCQAAGLDYLIDGCAEVNGADGSVASYYAKWLWTNITCWFYEGGVPCWKFTFSFLPDPESIAGLPNLFRGVNSDGPVNAPVYMNPHLYGADPQVVYDALAANGLGGHHWFIGEDYSLPLASDTDVPKKLRQFVVATKQPIERVCPWPVTTRTPEGTMIDAACVPPVFSQPWATYGL